MHAHSDHSQFAVVPPSTRGYLKKRIFFSRGNKLATHCHTLGEILSETKEKK